MARTLVERLSRSRRLYKGRSVDFHADVVRLPNGRRAIREYLVHPGAAAVVPFASGGKVVLVKQFRFPIRRTTYEIPAGKLDGRESPLSCIRRELREETGYTAGRLSRLMSFWPAPAFSDETLHIYVAEDLKPGTHCLDDDEFLEMVEVPFRTALSWIDSGKIRDSKTIIGLQACALNGTGAKRRRSRRSRGRAH